MQFVTAAESSSLPGDRVRASADRLALRTVESGHDQDAAEELVASGGVLFRAASPIVGADRKVVGAVVVSRHLDANLVSDAHRARAAYDRFMGLSVLRGPILGSYLSIFLDGDAADS